MSRKSTIPGKSSTATPLVECVDGNSRMHAVLRDFNWSISPLGPLEQWPQSLRNVVTLILDSPFPMCLSWGPDLRLLYNDAYLPILGEKHPSALGARMQDVWAEAWEEIAQVVDRVLAGKPCYFENFPVEIIRNRCPQRSWFNFSYSPVRDDLDRIGGILCICSEKTAQVLSQRRLAFQLEVSERLRGFPDPAGVIEHACALLGSKLGVARVGYVELDADAQTASLSGGWTTGALPPLDGQTESSRRLIQLMAAAIADGQASMVCDIAADARLAPTLRDYQALGIRSFLTVPAMQAGRLRALLYLHQPHAHFWASDATVLAQDTMDCISAALERMRENESKQRFEKQLRENAARQAFQLELADRLRPLSSPQEIIDAAGELLGRYLHASRVYYAEVDDAARTFHIRGEWISGEMESLPETGRIDTYGADTFEALRCGKAFTVNDVAADARTTDSAQAYAALAIRSILVVSLVKHGRLVVTLNVTKALPYHWNDEDVRVIEDVAERTWAAVERANAEAQLRAERDQSRYIFDSMTEGFELIGSDWTVRHINAAGLRIGLRTASETIGRNHWDVWPEGRGTEFEALIQRVKSTGTPGALEERHIRPGGEEFWVESRVYPLPDGGIAVFFRDITGRKQAEAQLLAQTERLQLATEAAELGLFHHNVLTGEINWSDKVYEHSGVPPDVKLSYEVIFAHIHPDDREQAQKLWAELTAPGIDRHYQTEYRTIGTDGRERWVAAKGKVYHDASARAVRLVGTTMDITERKRIEKQIQQASQHDSLTGLPNRALLCEYCSHILAMSARTGEAGALLFIDLDRFKPINDLYGHGVGDKVLQEVARRLLACTRKEDIVSRLGGDEFIVVLPRIDSVHDPATVAQHILHAIDQPIVIGTQEVSVSPSIGISLFPEHAQEFETLIRFADLAMYSAKTAGRDNFRIYSPGLNERADDLLRLEIRLKHSLESDELALFYQPIIDIASKKIVGAEALIRLRDESGNVLSPNDFIPVAEAAGLINDIGEWVVREACRQHLLWQEAGMPPLTIAVNVSPVQFRQPMFFASLERAIRESGSDPSWLQIEVTESTVMDNLAATIETLNKIRSLGIRIALDDFGTGYSSLSYLGSLPLDKLKIDQSFVRQLERSEVSRSITDAIIVLGRSLNLQLVGEGIESEQSMAYLRQKGCDQAQGYLFSRPLPPAQFETWYREQLAQSH